MHHNNTFKPAILINKMENEKKVKLALISGASHAIKYLRENPHASEDDAIQHISREAKQIIAKIEEEA